MTTELRYSPTALVLRSALMLIASAVVIADYVAHADGGFPRLFGLGFTPSAVLIATALYLVGVTVVLTLGLIRHGGVALAATGDGVTIHSAWFSRTLGWADVTGVALEVRYSRNGHYTVVAVHEASGVIRCHAINTRLLAETLDRVSQWVEGAEHSRVAHGGAPYVTPTSGVAAFNARWQASDVAADLAVARDSEAQRSTLAL